MNMERLLELLVDLEQKSATLDIFELCQALDIEILYLELGDILGFKTTFYDVSLIYVDQDLSSAKQRFITAHELGHILLHQGIKPLLIHYKKQLTYVSKMEKEADRFAVLLTLCHYYLTTEQSLNEPDSLKKQLAIPKHLDYLWADLMETLRYEPTFLKILYKKSEL